MGQALDNIKRLSLNLVLNRLIREKEENKHT